MNSQISKVLKPIYFNMVIEANLAFGKLSLFTGCQYWIQIISCGSHECTTSFAFELDLVIGVTDYNLFQFNRSFKALNPQLIDEVGSSLVRPVQEVENSVRFL